MPSARKVRGFQVVNDNIRKFSDMDIDNNPDNDGLVPAAVESYVTAVETGNGAYHQTVLTIVDLPITMRDTQQGGGAAIYTFPESRICRIGASASIAVTTTSALATTLNTGSTCNYGVGSVTQANATVATTEQDFVQVTAFTSSTTIDVASAVAAGVGVGVLASLSGLSTAVQAFLNLAVAGATDIDADATTTVSGTVTINWVDVASI